ncbi:hypothetical protein GGI03_001269 [Coemansia sp. RSA 2337]|nr:hypothetical protein GGI03_001269 [Coemansia sp. RSA 2337]
MAQVSAEQVLAKLKQNGTFDMMRQQMLSSFLGSSRSSEFDLLVKDFLERALPDNTTRGPDLNQLLEKRVVRDLERQGALEQLEKDARNFWLTGDRSDTTTKSIESAIGDLQSGGAECLSMLDVDPPRISGGQASRSHNYYRRGDTVVAFISLCDTLCEREPPYICVAAEVTACDAVKNMYTVRDPDAGARSTWVVYWDQLLAIKRPYECKYQVGDQVYALYRDDHGTDTAVSTEFFPGRVLSVGQLSLAVKFDSGALAHVYYDEVFAAGRVGFLRNKSAERRRRREEGAMVETAKGRTVPSFTGFWPEDAAPELNKHGRKVRYRQMPPILVAHDPVTGTGHKERRKSQGTELVNISRHSSPGSDMDIDNSSPEPPSPAVQPVARPQQHQQQQQPHAVKAQLPVRRPSPGSEEDGEIGGEEGECISDSAHRRIASPSRGRYAQDTRDDSSRRSRWDHRSPARRSERSRSRFGSSTHYRPPYDRGEYRRSRRSRSRGSSPQSSRHGYRDDRVAASGAPKPIRPMHSQRPAFNIYEQPLRVNVSLGLRSLARDLVTLPHKRQWSQLGDQIATATAYLGTRHAIPSGSVAITDAYTDSISGITHVYARQTINGLPVINGLANVNIDANGHVISASQSFAPPSLATSSSIGTDSFSLDSALASLIAYVGPESNTDMSPSTSPANISNGQCTASKALIYAANGIVTPVWHMSLRRADHWWSACVNTELGRIESLCDWTYTSEAFRVFPRTVLSPSDGTMQMVVSPANTTASPKGWVTMNTTAGNNVWAQSSSSGSNDMWINSYRPTASNKTFDYPLDLTQQPATYLDFSITQLFYTVNTLHDLAFIYGFDEAAGNFQDVNYSGLGKGGDYVIATAQDSSGVNNAMFESPPDGQHGRMRMFVWTMTTPNRDGDLEQDIVAHEFTHGISSRLTGGPANADCLGDGEPAGMGEGWSDAVANLLRIRVNHTRNVDIIVGEYVYGAGIRKYPYSTSLKTNPTTYGYLDKPEFKEVHAVGEVWAEMLYEVTWNLVDKNGISGDLLAHDLTKGNALMMQIMLGGMKLQPCNPSFVDARNAIVQAENTLTGGKNHCALWHGFAKRGLGIGAKFDGRQRKEDFGVPEACLLEKSRV